MPAAIWRKQRLAEISLAQARALVDAFEADYFAARFVVLGVTAAILDDAALHAARHGLRAYDAVQLASALAARNADPRCDALAAHDRALRAAAAAEGLELLE